MIFIATDRDVLLYVCVGLAAVGVVGLNILAVCVLDRIHPGWRRRHADRRR